jgi:Tfp pilus assembly protein FimV
MTTALLLVTVASRAAATLRDVPASVSEGRTAPALSLSAEPAGPSGGVAAVASSGGSRLPYVVQPGDTIWSIARRLQPTGDVRALVDALVERNGGAALDVGQRLAVP